MINASGLRLALEIISSSFFRAISQKQFVINKAIVTIIVINLTFIFHIYLKAIVNISQVFLFNYLFMLHTLMIEKMII